MASFRWFTAGESHGPELVAWVEGCPAGVPILAEQIDVELARRQRGYGRGGRMKIETDRARLVTGIRNGETLGSPITLIIDNKDFPSWKGRMGPEPFDAPPERLSRPRPGHADLAGGMKYDRRDMRDILERASARETAARVAAGSVARRLLEEVGIRVASHVVSVGGIDVARRELTFDQIRDLARASDLACTDAESEGRWREAIHTASHAGDTLGGVVEVITDGVPVGLGSHVSWDRKLDGRLAQALMSVPAFKGVEIGLGFDAARRRGSEVHDPIGYDGKARRFTRPTNGAGGLEGGITNGEPLVVRGAMKPISTLRRALRSVDIDSKESVEAAFERSDICAVAAASVIAEAMVCLVLADALLEKTGGDSLAEVKRNLLASLAAQEVY